MRFEWNETKRLKVIRDHGVDFRDLALAWAEGLPPSVRSDQHGEERYVGFAEIKGELWAGIYTIRDGNIRFVTARRWKRRDSRKLGQLLAR